MRTTAILALLCAMLASCGGDELPSTRSTVPAEWVAEAWLSTQAWVQREMFPCQICYGFHGQSPESGGPAYLMNDARISVDCPECAGTGYRSCTVCGGKGGGVCEICSGFGDVRCDNTRCSLVRIDQVEWKPTAQDLVFASKGCAECDWKGGDCPECRVGRRDLSHLMVAETGRSRLASREPCETCRDRGVIDCPNCRGGFRDCDSCRGAGFERSACPRCLGEGQMHPRKLKFERSRVRVRPDE